MRNKETFEVKAYKIYRFIKKKIIKYSKSEIRGLNFDSRVSLITSEK